MKPHIETRRHLFNPVECGDCQHGRHADEDAHHKSVVNQMLFAAGQPMITDWKPRGDVEAIINDGRWLVQCPLTGCGGAERVDPDWPLAVCTARDGCGSGPFRVIFPPPAKRAAIEAELVIRPVMATRNWKPGETPAQLRKENAEPDHAAEIAMGGGGAPQLTVVRR